MFKRMGLQKLNLYLILLAIILGFWLGHNNPHTALKLGFLGTIFLNALFMMVVPLVMASMVSGIARLGHLRELGALGGRTIVYYMSTTAISVIIGIILVNIIQPGKGVTRLQDIHPQATYRIQPTPLIGGSNVTLTGDSEFFGDDYTSRFVIELMDQKICGLIDDESRLERKRIHVLYWIDESGKKAEPQTTGVGVQI